MTKKQSLIVILLLPTIYVFATKHNSKLNPDEDSISKKKCSINLHGTIRSKYEYQTNDSKGRFEVRNARVSIDGNIIHSVRYKAEIDLSDEGQIKMLDAYGQINPISKLELRIGQMRVPFTIDAHRSPHNQYFANRSFIAKQVGNIRDVGFSAAYTINTGLPVKIEAGLFNGSGLTNQKDFWTDNVNFSAKVGISIPKGFSITLSTQRIKPENISIMMYDCGAFYHAHNIHIETEYLLKHYDDKAFKDVNAINAFACYDINIGRKKSFIKKVSPLIRYDYMSDHSDGTANDEGRLNINDYERHRITGGVTISLNTPFVSDIRINYEKYFYTKNDFNGKKSERDKIAAELMVHF